MWHRRRFLLLAGTLFLGTVGPAIAPIAAQASPPHDGVILTVTGALANAASGRVEFDRSALERLGLTKLTTWTPWTEGEVEFEGVLARRLVRGAPNEQRQTGTQPLQQRCWWQQPNAGGGELDGQRKAV